MKLDDKLIEIIKPAMDSTWRAIADDVEPGVQSDRSIKKKDYNHIAIESVIDAGHIKMYGGSSGPVIDFIVGAAIDEHGYEVVMDFFKKHFNYL